MEHITINSDRSVTVPVELRKIGVQYDHNVNTIEFVVPRYSSNVDLSTMTIYINYILSDKTPGKYKAENVIIDDQDDSLIRFNWTITRNVTKVSGILSCLVCAKKTDEEGNEINHWNTDIFRLLSVSEGMENDLVIQEQYPDVITSLIQNVNEHDAKLLEFSGLDTRVTDIENNVNELKGDLGDLEKEAITFKREIVIGKNLFNPAACVEGNITTSYSSGDKQTITPNSNMVTQKIILDKNFDYALNGIRMYVITDENDIRVIPKDESNALVFINEGSTAIVDKSNYGENSYYLWVSAYKKYQSNLSQVEKGNVCTNYEPYSETIVEEFRQKDETVDDFPNKMVKEIKNNLDNILKSKSNKMNNTVSSKHKIDVQSVSGKKILLRLHKSHNKGCGADNDVYLPFAKEDFSDVRISTDSNVDIKYMLQNRINGIDFVQDTRIGNPICNYFQNSDGDIFTCFNHKIRKSKDYGATWSEMTSINISDAFVCCITANDTMFFSKSGILYKCEKPYSSYHQVADFTGSYTSPVFILSSMMIELSNDTLICAAYQTERAVRIYKSIDGGENWSDCYIDTSGTYQHVHNLHLDKTVTPNAIYAGCDGGGGVLKSTDGGVTWSDLRILNPDMPQASDHGVIYSDESGYKLLGGETSIVGGYTLIKTTDEQNYRGILGVGNGCYIVEKYKGLLIAPLIGSTSYRNAAIAVSNDDGENWATIFTTSALTHDNTASDGCRFLSKINTNMGEELLIGVQSNTQPSIRVTNGCYAEIVVDVPDDASYLMIESGYNGADYEVIENDYVDSLPVITKYDFSSDDVIDNYILGGKYFPYIYPNIGNESDKYAISMEYLALNPLELTMDISDKSAITISFWGCNLGKELSLIEETDSGNGYGIRYTGYIYKMPVKETICKVRNACIDTWDKFDFVIDFTNNIIKTYLNGVYVASNGDVDVSEQLNALKSSHNFKMFRKLWGTPTGAIQHVEIFDGAKTEQQIFDGFNCGLVDMINN